MKERLQKVLANLGLGSRREIESWISEGRIKVNGETAELGCQVDGTETVLLDGRKISIENGEQERRVLIYYKPEGEITTRHDPEGRPTIFDSLPRINDGRWITVGRLDINTQGLLLVTNDGELAHRLMHPSHELEREYAVRVIGDFTDEMADNMKKGIEFEDGLSKFEDILWSGGTGANFWYHVTVKGGKNREVRRLWESQGLMVSRLIRIRYGNVELPKGLREGQFIDIDADVLKGLVESVGLEHQRVVLDEKTERQRSKARRVGGNQQDRRRELNRDNRSFGSQDARRHEGDRFKHRDDSRGSRPEGRPFNRDNNRSEGRSFNRDNNRSEGRPFNRDNNRSEGRSFNRDNNRSEGRPFNRDNNRSEGRPFNRDNNRSEGRPFNRDNNRSEGRPFNRDNNRSEGRPFNRDNRSEGRSFDRNSNRSEGRSFDRNSNRSEDRSFDRNSNRSEGRSFDRNSNRSEGRSFDRNSNRSEGRSFDRNSNRSEGRSFDRNSNRSEGRSFDRNSNRSEGRSFDRNSNRSEGRSFDRNNNRSEGRSFDRNSNRSEGRSFDRSNNRSEGRSFGSQDSRRHSRDETRSFNREERFSPKRSRD
ncbi:23S rRNA pseudouridine(2605) synthase RluB [Ignatzschineria sp. LJL83]